MLIGILKEKMLPHKSLPEIFEAAVFTRACFLKWRHEKCVELRCILLLSILQWIQAVHWDKQYIRLQRNYNTLGYGTVRCIKCLDYESCTLRIEVYIILKIGHKLGSILVDCPFRTFLSHSPWFYAIMNNMLLLIKLLHPLWRGM